MAPEKKDKKRKAAAVSSVAAPSEQPVKKTKKTANKSTELKAAKASDATNGATTKSSPAKLENKPARQVKPRKRAADFLSDNEDVQEKTEKVKKAAVQPTEDSSKPAKKKSKKAAESESPAAKVKDVEGKGKKGKLISGPGLRDTELASDSEDEGASEEDDQTAALIKGFESSDDEEDASGDDGLAPGQEVPTIPDSKQVKRKLAKMKKRQGEPEEPGVIYISRIPHGFYEHEMRAYFSQFGEITRLRLSRNRTTGRSKHYAFIEFSSASVARIVADTMNNYLMFGHIVKCKVIPLNEVHPRLWEGANRRFKQMPWNKIEKRRLDAGYSRDKWAKKVDQEEKKRLAKAEKLKELGYEIEAPKLKGVDDVPVREKQAQIEAEKEEPKAIEAPVEETVAKPAKQVEEAPKEVSNKRKKQGKKESAATPEKKKATVEDAKPKEKAKPAATPEKKPAAVESPVVKDKKKSKKNKKAKA